MAQNFPLVTKRAYKRKTNLKRFFYPQEWSKFLSVISNEKHRFFFEILMHTGARHNEIKNLKIRDINFEREQLILNIGKTGSTGKSTSREIQISSWLTNRLRVYVKSNSFGKLDTLGLPSVQYMDRIMKEYCQKAGIEDYQDFSAHNLRKTLENYLIALNVNVLAIQAHMGHLLDIAAAHYVAASLFTAEDKTLIRQIIDNLLQK
jgi:integrase